MEERLYIDGELVDLGTDTGIVLSMRSNLFMDASKISGNMSYTIKLPKTSRNARIMGWADRLDSLSRKAYKKHVARYFRGGVELVSNGTVCVLSASDEGYEVSLVWGCRPKFAKLVDDGPTLRDLNDDVWMLFQAENSPSTFSDFDGLGYGYMNTTAIWVDESASLDEWQGANFIGWWVNPAYSIDMKKVAEQGNGGGDGTRMFVSFARNHPAMTVKRILDDIEADYGVRIKFSGDAKMLVDSLAVPCIGKEATEITYGTAGLVGFMTQLALRDWCTFSAFATADVVFGTIGTTVQSVSVLTDAKLLVTADITLRYRWQVLNIAVKNDGKSTVDVAKLEFVVTHQDNSEDRYKIGADSSVYIRDLWEEKKGLEERLVARGYMEVKAGDVIRVYCVPQAELVDIYVDGGFTMQAVADDSADVPIGGRFPIVHNLPEVKIVDFIKFLAAITGTFVKQGGDDDVVEFVAYDDIVENASQAVDWSSRLIASTDRNIPRKVSYRMSGWARHNWFRWKEDKRTRGMYDGELYVDDETIDETREAMTFPFAASDGNVVPMYEQKREDDGQGNVTISYEYSKIEPRILRYRDTNVARGYFDLDMGRIISEHYKLLANSLNHAKVVEERFMLSDVEVKEFDETIPVWLAQYGRYFSVLELRSDGSGVATAQMIALDVESQPIKFADPEVERICVENWGANGVITKKQAAAVTSLGGVFKGNRQITSFDELRFFTGLTRISTMYSDGQGEFYDCRNLKSIILPSLNLSVADFRGMFKLCKSLKTLDLTPVKANTYYIYQIANNIDIYGDLEGITIPGGYYGRGDSSTYSYMLYAFRDCRNLTTIHIDGIADFSGIGFFINGSNLASTAFYRCAALTTITGTIVGINRTFNIQYSPLTRESAVVLLNGLKDRTGSSQLTITFKASTYATLTQEDIAIATNKNWQVASV